MYPADELEEIAKKKRGLIARAAVARANCYLSGERAIQPVYWLDAGREVWKRLRPFIELGALVFSRNRFGRRLGIFGLAVKWGPKLWKAARIVKQSRNNPPPTRPEPAPV